MKKKVIPAIALGAIMVATHSESVSAANTDLLPTSVNVTDANVRSYTLQDVKNDIRRILANISGFDEEMILDDDLLVDFGMDSLNLLIFARQTEAHFNITFNVALFLVNADVFTLAVFSQQILEIHMNTYPRAYE